MHEWKYGLHNVQTGETLLIMRVPDRKLPALVIDTGKAFGPVAYFKSEKHADWVYKAFFEPLQEILPIEEKGDDSP